MVEIVNLGSFLSFERQQTLDALFQLLEDHTLDPIFEKHGGFINRSPKWRSPMAAQTFQGAAVIAGSFLSYDYIFHIITDEEPLISRFEVLVQKNMSTQAYQAARAERLASNEPSWMIGLDESDDLGELDE